MAIREEEFDLPVDEGAMAVFLYEPEDSGPVPSIIMVHDANGLTVEAREQARWLAGHGYAVAAPDVFHRAGRLLTTAALGGGPEATLQVRAGMTNDGHCADITRLAAYLRERTGGDGRVGLTGFCLGGRIAFLGATLGGVVDATVAFYPTRLLESDPAIPGSPWPVHGAGNVTNPLLMFFPALDGFNPYSNIETIRAAFGETGDLVRAVWVEDADHAFAQPETSAYHPVRAAKAWEDALAFFDRHLRRAESPAVRAG